MKNKVRLLQLKKETLRRKYPKLWTAKYHHKTTHGKVMRFDGRFKCLAQIYKELDRGGPGGTRIRRWCCRKSVQNGVSDVLIVACLDDAAQGLRVLSIFPDNTLRGDFVNDRFNTLLETVPYYARGISDAVGSTDNVGLKHFYKGLVKFSSSKTKASFVSFQADVVHVEEEDLCDQINLGYLPDRMDGSDFKIERRVGNPSAEGWGIDKHYQKSSQGVYMIRCDGCREWQPFDFFVNMLRQVGDMQYDVLSGGRKDPQFVCRKCSKILNRFGESSRWVETFPDRLDIGRHMSQLFSANVFLVDLVDSWFDSLGNDTLMQLFYNSKLGLPYSSSGNKLTLSLLEAVAKSSYALPAMYEMRAVKANPLYVGIDVGKYFHIVGRQLLSNSKRPLAYLGKTTSADEVIAILKRLDAKVIVVDEKPETKKVEDLKKKISRLYSCDFRLGKTLLDIDKKSRQYRRERKVRIDRTFLIDCVKADYTKHLIINPTNAKDLFNTEMDDYGEFYRNLLSSTRIYEERSNRYIWREASADHFLLAEAYCKLAELLHDRVLSYYVNATQQFADKSVAEMVAAIGKQGKLIPQKDDGTVDLELLSAMSAQTFLNRIFMRTESILNKEGK